MEQMDILTTEANTKIANEHDKSRAMRNTTFHICENKGADQL